jgi:hypothetical protein
MISTLTPTATCHLTWFFNKCTLHYMIRNADAKSASLQKVAGLREIFHQGPVYHLTWIFKLVPFSTTLDLWAQKEPIGKITLYQYGSPVG